MVVDDFSALLSDMFHHSWQDICAAIRSRAKFWTDRLLTDDSLKDQMARIRADYINKEKTLNLNPCAKRTRAFRKAFLGPKGSGSITIAEGSRYYSDRYYRQSNVDCVIKPIPDIIRNTFFFSNGEENHYINFKIRKPAFLALREL